MKYLLFFITCFSLLSCNINEEDVFGYYAPINYKNTFDTIQIKDNGIYHRKVYDKDRNLLLEMDGKWRFANGRSSIQFSSFFLNLDSDIYPEQLSDTLGEWQASINKHGNSIEFCVGYYVDENCYRKIQ
jgi:hypothetical protein